MRGRACFADQPDLTKKLADLLALLEPRPAPVTEPQSRLIEHDADHAVFEVIAPRNLVYFDGHFHGQPILAGVVQIDWVIAYGRRYFDLPPLFRAVHALKFQRVIGPDTPFRLELVYDPARTTLSFKISTALGIHASGRVLFGGADEFT